MAIDGEKRLSGNHSGLFRVRRGWFGKSVLQECIDSPPFIGGIVDSHTRDLRWEDVPYNKAPRALISQLTKHLGIEQ